MRALLAADPGNWANPFPTLHAIVFAAAVGVVPLLALIALVWNAIDHEDVTDD